MDQYYSIDELAAKFGLHANTIRHLVHDGEFPNAIRVGRVIRIPLPDILAYGEKYKLELEKF